MNLNNLSNETIYPGQKLKLLINQSELESKDSQEDIENQEIIEKDSKGSIGNIHFDGIYLGFDEIFQGDLHPEFGLKGFLYIIMK